MTFLTAFNYLTGRTEVAEKIVQKPVEPVSGPIKPVLRLKNKF